MGSENNYIKSTINITSFEQGMMDAMDMGKSFKDGYSLEAVRYMENLNPNIIHFALVKRLSYETFAMHIADGYGHLKQIFRTDAPAMDIEQYGTSRVLDWAAKRYSSPYAVHRRHTTMPYDDTYVNTYNGQEELFPHENILYPYRNVFAESMVIGIDAIRLYEPAGMAYFVILRDDVVEDEKIVESSSINGYYPIYGVDANGNFVINQRATAWVNPLYDQIVQDEEYPYKGRRIYGTVTDWTKMGQAVFLTTLNLKLNPSTQTASEEMRSVYRWSQIDYKNIKIDPIFNQQVPKRNYFVVGFDSKIPVGQSVFMLPRSGYERISHLPDYKGTRRLHQVGGTVEPADQYVGVRGESRWYENTEDKGLPEVDVLFWQSKFFPKYIKNDYPTGSLQHVREIGHGDETVPPTGQEGAAHWYPYRFEINGVATIGLVRANAVPLGGTNSSAIPTNSVMSQDEGTLVPTSEVPQSSLVAVASPYNNGAASNAPNRTYTNYDAAQIPRDWSAGERIPYVLTAVVNGAEILYKQDTFVMAQDAPLHSGNMRLNTTTMSFYRRVNGEFYDAVHTFPPGTMYVSYPTTDKYSKSKVTNIEPGYADTLNSFVYFTLRLNISNQANLFELLPPGLTSFKLYVSQPRPGTQPYEAKQGRPLGLYESTSVIDTELDFSYSLVKEFPMKQNLTPVSDTDFTNFSRGNQGDSLLKHGKWVYHYGTQGVRYYVGYAKQRHATEGYYFVPNGLTLVNDLLPNRMLDPVSPDDYPFTPDFCLWDYPRGASLVSSLGSLVTPWHGKGARCITSVGPFTVIGGTISDEDIEEVGRIRRSGLQGTVPLTTEFAELDYVDVLNEQVVAVKYFRDSIWVFGRNSIGRVSSTNPFNIDSWRVIDKIEGQGVSNIKHVLVTTDYIYFANQNGIWRSDGGNIENVVIGILHTYQNVYSGKTFFYNFNRIDIPYDKPEGELFYDPEQNEIGFAVNGKRDAGNILELPAANIEVSLIFNLLKSNWRIETVELPTYNHGSTKVVNTSTLSVSHHNRIKFIDIDGKLGHPLLYGAGRIGWIKRNLQIEEDSISLLYLHDYGEARKREEDTYPLLGQQWEKAQSYRIPFAGILRLHEVGNGIDDHQLRKVILEAERGLASASLGVAVLPPLHTPKDPRLFVELRNQSSWRYGQVPSMDPVPSPEQVSRYDLIELNSRGSLSSPYYSHLNKPEAQSWTSRESLVLNTPLSSKFRRCELTFAAFDLSYLRSIEVVYSVFRRKKWA